MTLQQGLSKFVGKFIVSSDSAVIAAVWSGLWGCVKAYKGKPIKILQYVFVWKPVKAQGLKSADDKFVAM